MACRRVGLGVLGCLRVRYNIVVRSRHRYVKLQRNVRLGATELGGATSPRASDSECVATRISCLSPRSPAMKLPSSAALTIARRALLPLPLLLVLPTQPAPAADTFDCTPPAPSFFTPQCPPAVHLFYVCVCVCHAVADIENGETKKLTELEARDRLTQKVNAATDAGKGLDVDRRGQFNEKALFSEDFYFKYGLRPDPDEVLRSPFLPPQAELPFAPVQRRYTGYTKYSGRILSGINLYGGALRNAVADGAWGDIPVLLEKGRKGSGNNAQGEGTGVAASEMRSACRAFGLFGNTVLQSENDSGTTTANLLARHLINEAYLSMDDIAAAAEKKDTKAAAAAWTRGKDYINGYIRIINLPISSKVGDKFPMVDASI